MSRTSVLIAPSGGLAAIALFLQPGATAIVPNYWVVALNTSEQQENIQFWNFEHVRPIALVFSMSSGLQSTH